jgi:hypothetical protein
LRTAKNAIAALVTFGHLIKCRGDKPANTYRFGPAMTTKPADAAATPMRDTQAIDDDTIDVATADYHDCLPLEDGPADQLLDRRIRYLALAIYRAAGRATVTKAMLAVAAVSLYEAAADDDRREIRKDEVFNKEAEKYLWLSSVSPYWSDRVKKVRGCPVAYLTKHWGDLNDNKAGHQANDAWNKAKKKLQSLVPGFVPFTEAHPDLSLASLSVETDDEEEYSPFIAAELTATQEATP